MNRKNQKALEPKFAGSRKRLTEGEAGEILRDQEQEWEDEEFALDDLPVLAFSRSNRPC